MAGRLHEPLLDGDGDAPTPPPPVLLPPPMSDSFAAYLADVVAHESTTGVRPRLLYEQRRLQVCLPPLATVGLALTFVCLGLGLALPDSALVIAAQESGRLRRHNVVLIGCVLFVLGLLLAPVCLWVSMCVATPSRKRRQREAVVQDAMLEELLAGQALQQHYDVVQPAAPAPCWRPRRSCSCRARARPASSAGSSPRRSRPCRRLPAPRGGGALPTSRRP